MSMSTRELLEMVDRDPAGVLGLYYREDDIESRLDALVAADLLDEKWSGDLFSGWTLTADGRDLLHGASERRLSA